ncbi:MAG: exodeoxyribonuclease VII large subunit, partial [Planctomycetes bacterium]|nr:exodeoxyribonuclease VII large subunit [Planctomycetota bacterium]
QFYIDKLEPAGIGPLELAFRQLSDKLRKEGLFDPRHKKMLPPFPQTIAIVTSASGAAIEDIKKTLNRRFPIVKKLLFPVPVQGEEAPVHIASAIHHINRRTDMTHIDLIILARGGGSIEDLWAFNEESVARAIYHSIIPIITGIGHEIDLTIADLVADQHAITPTAAAELAVPVLEDILNNLQLTQQRLSSNVRRYWKEKNDTLMQLASRPLFTKPLDTIRFKQQHMDEYSSSLEKTLAIVLGKNEHILESHLLNLQKIEPPNVIKLGHTHLKDRLIRLKSAFQLFYQNQKHYLSNFALKCQAASPIHLIQKHTSQLNYINNRLNHTQKQTLHSTHQKIEQMQKRLENLDPHAILNRGYSITRKTSDNSIVTNKSQLNVGEMIVTELADKNNLVSKINKINKRNPQNPGSLQIKKG